MSEGEDGLEETTIKIGGRSNFWKFFIALAAIVLFLGMSYMVWTKSNGWEAPGGNPAESSFFLNIGEGANEALSNVFNTGSESDFVEVVNVKTGGRAVDEGESVTIQEPGLQGEQVVLSEDETGSDELPQSPEASEPAGPININTAGYDELQQITGVGPAIAGRIIDYRNENGLFYSAKEIQNVNGIGPATFEKMKDEITVGDVGPPPPEGPAPPPPEEGEPEEEAPPPPEEEPEEPIEDEPDDLSTLQITDVVFDVEGLDDGNERVTISNVGSEAIDLSDSSLQYVSSAGDYSKVKKKNFESGHSVPPGGNFIVGMNCHTATPCVGVDMSWSQALGNAGGTVYLVSNQEKLTDAGDPDVINSFSYSN